MYIRDKDLQSLYKLFNEIKQPVEIWAYGSRVNNTAHDASDLDLVIRTQNLKAMSVTEYSLLLEKITDSNIPILVELRDWTTLPTSFHRQIEKQYEVIYSNFNKG
ncbi:MAG: nucleotidyltransferase domain-containing protein [Paludibacter sp.]